VYLNEQRLNAVLLPFLATALFGPERTDYWRHALDVATEPERTASASERASEIQAGMADVAPLLGGLPILAEQLADAHQGELRALFDSLQLGTAYQPTEGALDVTLTLYDPEGNDGTAAARESAEDWSAPPASHNANLKPLVEGPAITLAARHAKVRRAGYVK
jgi:hypothetical protein